MRRAVLAGVISTSLVIGFTAAVSAADIAVRPPVTKAMPTVVAPYNWTGFYVGGHVGGAWGNKAFIFDSPAPTDIGSHDVSGLIAGGQIGFNVQSGNWVFGAEVQASWADVDGDHVWTTAPNLGARTKVKWVGTIAGRIGYAWDRWLIYAKGGAAWIGDDYQLTIITPAPSVFGVATDDRWGWMVGGGIEWGLTNNWSVKVEYNYLDFGSETVRFTRLDVPSGFNNVEVDQRIHLVKLGINYRFGGPIVARY